MFYREIYKDTKRYNGWLSKSILKDFLDSKGDVGILDYYFIDEKINKGMFREYGLLKEFYRKNELQENLYKLVCMNLAELEPDIIVNGFGEEIEVISKKVYQICKKHPDYTYQGFSKINSDLEAYKKYKLYKKDLEQIMEEDITSEHLLEIMKISLKKYKLQV